MEAAGALPAPNGDAHAVLGEVISEQQKGAVSRGRNYNKSVNTLHKNIRGLHDKYSDMPHVLLFGSCSKSGQTTVTALIAGAHDSELRAKMLSHSCLALLQSVQGKQAPQRSVGGDPEQALARVLQGLQADGKLCPRSANEIASNFRGANTICFTLLRKPALTCH